MELLTKASTSNQVTIREMENLSVAYQAACEAIVLLKNDGTLPLKTKTVALYGPGASMTIKGGTGSGEVNERHSVTVLEGLLNRGFQVTTQSWIAEYEELYRQEEAAYRQRRRKQINLLKPNTIMEILFSNFRFPAGPEITESRIAESRTDSCIYVLSRQAGEGGDRRAEKGDLYPTDEEVAAIKACAAGYRNFVLVINCGSFMDLSVLDDVPGIGSILFICQLGSQGGNAVADVISGDVVPSGRLADTWPMCYDDVPFAQEYSYLNGDLDNEYYKEGIYVGYRYFDTFGVVPRYPFGYGLSYTQFSMFSAGFNAEGSQITLRANVTNTGDTLPGKEVVQLYISAPQGQLHKEYQSLATFAKTGLLAPGQSETVEMSFNLREMASYREADGCYVLEAGDYILRLGRNCRDTVPVGVLTLNQEVIISKHQHICPIQQPIDELTGQVRETEELNPGLPRILLDATAFQTIVYRYDAPEISTDPWVQRILCQLNLKQMIDIVVGNGMFGGDNRFNLPGSVGNTTSKYWDKGLANVALCDGPAGLRIQKHSTVDTKGKVKPVEMALSIFEMLPGFVKSFMVGDPEKEQELFQYTTAFPVTAAMAQTWNTELLYQMGTAIYREMKEYGCTYWLAPAVNIHRNPLCGRNFEYFSEDPRLTGLLASALTIGVQQEEGFYVTVKHYACNNQEDNRNRVSSNLSERTLREIYLKPFELTVRTAGAKSIMTSYNMVNGIYAPNSYDLCTKVLRNEWGFDGVVMTDWFSTNKGQADNALAMHAGNDLIMPGGRMFSAEILAGVKTGKCSVDDVRRCCANVIKAILASATQREYIR